MCTFEDERCTADGDCAEDLVCRSGECFDACAAGSCPAGGVCADGICQRPDGSDAGPPTDDAGVAFPRRVGCTSDIDCGAGVCTRALSGAYECRTRCGTPLDCPPAPATVGCGYFQALTGGLVLACSLPCDLFAGGASGCAAGTACDVFELSTDSGANAPVVDCRALDSGALGPGGVCGSAGGWDPTLCAASLTCDGNDPFTCQELCTITGAFGPPCPSGSTCEDFGSLDVRYRGARIGSCDPI